MARESKKEIIREAAIEVMADRGFHAATTDYIAEVAGVSVGTIYNYFRNKEEILSYIFETELAKRIEWFEALIQSELSPKRALFEFLQKHFESVVSRPDVARVLVRERSFSRGQDPLAVHGYLEKIPRLLMTVMQTGQRAGYIRDLDPQLVGTAIFGMIESLTRHAVETGSSQDVLDRLPDLVSFLWEGLTEE